MTGGNRSEANSHAIIKAIERLEEFNVKAFERLDHLSAKHAASEADMSSVKMQMGTLATAVTNLAGKVDTLSENVTKNVASRWPSLYEILGIILTTILIVAGLTAGIGVYVGAEYSAPIADMQGRLARTEAALATRDAEDRAELTRVRIEDRLSLGRRLDQIEDRAGWAARSTPATN